ncbi:MAG: alkaline shock response membrane anchor protein AmaP [Nitrospira sp.]|nr:alkaline shock response membrane anchor protein AmaP [Nitrospira sp.]
MNLLNRLLVLFGILIAMIGAAILLFTTLGAWPLEQVFSSPWDQLLTPWTKLEGAHWWGVVTVCFILLCVGPILLIAELVTCGKKTPTVTVKIDNLGQITVSHASIQDLVNREAEAIDGVMESETAVYEGTKGLTLDCRLSVAPNTAVNPLATQVQEKVKLVVERYVGKPVIALNIQTQMAPLRKKKRTMLPRVR